MHRALKTNGGMLFQFRPLEARPSLATTGAVNATRNYLFGELRDLGLPVECSTGGRTNTTGLG